MNSMACMTYLQYVYKCVYMCLCVYKIELFVRGNCRSVFPMFVGEVEYERREQLRQKRAGIARCWIKYCLNLMQDAKKLLEVQYSHIHVNHAPHIPQLYCIQYTYYEIYDDCFGVGSVSTWFHLNLKKKEVVSFLLMLMPTFCFW